ncbi:N6-adenosine-specific RNA methylase IME4 [Knoellia remsis]|uniref:N6-adenosine-specific RNA methylase IME4 n=1 Tax=Knoellia remsis TaxID=407159 RepID=A0A2T0UGW5_9MICO|nr:S-adenosylmethionine-binding domain-containing protein [Knoellia remsis]PRY57152.1 N6-adenosine-specific RNA methylase IME4 [Knoellia remsis]
MTVETIQPLRPDSDPAPLPEVVGGFKTILADPPWRFTNRTGKVAPEHRRLDRYSTMTLAAIKDIDVAGVAAKDAHLYLWVPNALLPDGLAVMEAWGFRYVSNVVWAKRRKDGGPDGRGVGFYFRNVTELLLFGVRGSMRTLPPARRQVNMIETRKREHSRKPDEQYELIEACSPGPHLELFARYPRKGWSVWGDEALDEVAPRGKVHRGYAGGPIVTPDLVPYERLQPDTRAAVAAVLREGYEDRKKSIRDLAAETGYSIQRVRALLDAAEAEIRPRGAAGRSSGIGQSRHA